MKLTTERAILIVAILFLSTFVFIGYSGSPISNASKSYSVTPTSTPIPTNQHANQYELETLVNEYRSDTKRESLIHDTKLCEWADKRLPELKREFSHDIFHKESGDFLKSNQYSKVGENATQDYFSSLLALEALKLSPSHNRNMLDPQFTHTCVRCSGNYCVQLFGGK